MRQRSALGAASLAIILASASVISGQRSSPQFSFPPPNTNQFGDLFGSNGPNQDLSSGLAAAVGQPLQSTNSAGPQGSTFIQFTGSQSPAQNSFAASLQNQFQVGPKPPPQQQQQLVAQQQQQFQPFIGAAPQPLAPAQLPLGPSSQVATQPQQQQQQPSQGTRPSQTPSSQVAVTQPRPAANHQQQQQTSASISSSAAPQSPSSTPTTSLVSGSGQPTLSARRQAQANAANSQQRTAAAATVSASVAPASSSPQQQPVAAAAATARHQAQQRQSAAAAAHTHNQLPLAGNQPSQQSQQAAVESARRSEATQASLAAGASGHSYQCPDSFGYFRHHKSCDKYWACDNGTATLKLCGNGLMFDDSDPKRENCAYPFSVDCGSDRTDLEPPISTPNCPRLYGLFSDQANCRIFYSCWNGEASKYECPPGLAYDSEQRVCVWADLVERCDQSEVSDGFVCPDPSEVDQPGHYTRHAHPTDCRKFYVCIDGVARPYGCSFGTVFNVDSLQCDEPESVSGCEKYYGELDPKTAKKLARENSSGQSSQAKQQ